MDLAVFGSGEFTDAVDNVDRYLIERFKPKNVAVIPAAAGMESDAHKWIDMALAHYAKFDLPVISVPIFNKEQANDENLTELLADADWIFFSGGNPGYLMETLAGSKLWERVMERVNNGALLAGSSAGAMIMGKFLMSAPSFKSLFGGNGIVWHDGFGLVDYTVLPHFDHFKKFHGLINKIIETSPDKVHSAWIGIDENTAIIYSNTEPVVRGLGGVEIHAGDDTKYLEPET
jgi:cyanophycinase